MSFYHREVTTPTYDDVELLPLDEDDLASPTPIMSRGAVTFEPPAAFGPTPAVADVEEHAGPLPEIAAAMLSVDEREYRALESFEMLQRGEDGVVFADADSPTPDLGKYRRRRSSVGGASFVAGGVVAQQPPATTGGASSYRGRRSSSVSHAIASTGAMPDSDQEDQEPRGGSELWRVARQLVLLQLRAAGIVRIFRDSGLRRAARQGVEAAEATWRRRLSAMAMFQLEHLVSVCTAVRSRELFERELIENLFARSTPSISANEAGMFSMGLSCRRSVADRVAGARWEGGSYCRVYKGTYLNPVSRPSTEMFEFDVDVTETSQPFTVEVWQAEHAARDAMLASFQLVPQGLPRQGKGSLQVSMHWDFTATRGQHARGGRRGAGADAEKHLWRDDLWRECRAALGRLFDEERRAFRAIGDAFALEERLLDDCDRRATIRALDALMSAEHGDRLAMVRSYRQSWVVAEEALCRDLMMEVQCEELCNLMQEAADGIDARFRTDLAELRDKHGLVARGTTALFMFALNQENAVDGWESYPTPQLAASPPLQRRRDGARSAMVSVIDAMDSAPPSPLDSAQAPLPAPHERLRVPLTRRSLSVGSGDSATRSPTTASPNAQPREPRRAASAVLKQALAERSQRQLLAGGEHDESIDDSTMSSAFLATTARSDGISEWIYNDGSPQPHSPPGSPGGASGNPRRRAASVRSEGQLGAMPELSASRQLARARSQQPTWRPMPAEDDDAMVELSTTLRSERGQSLTSSRTPVARSLSQRARGDDVSSGDSSQLSLPLIAVPQRIITRVASSASFANSRDRR